MADDASSNPYIRTFAKDVAQLTGKEPEAVKDAPVSPPTTPTTAKEPEAPDADRQAVLARLRDRAAKDPVHEGTFVPPEIPTPMPKVEAVPESEFKAPTPPPAAPSEERGVQRSSLLPQAPVAPVASTFVPPTEPVAPISLENVSPIHTYTSDFSDRIDTKKASAFSVLAAQGDAHAGEPEPATPHKRRTGLLITGLGIVLVAIGGGGAYAAYWYVSQHATVPVILPVPSLVFADDREALKGTGPELVQALVASENDPLPEGEVRVLYLTESTTTATGGTQEIPLSGGALISALNLSAPDVLLRNVAPESTVGIVHAGNQTEPFFILKVLSYESTFAGMLAWEGTMQDSLTAFYPTYPAPPAPPPTIATTTTIVKVKEVVATTTVAAPPVVVAPPQFIDEVASNHDVRALKDGKGNTILLYGYVDKSTLVIARDEAAFAELVNRLTATKQQ